MKERFRTTKYAAIVFKTPENELAEWFGYYNYDPLDSSHDRLLVHRANFDGRHITETDIVEIGYYNINSGEWTSLGKTDSFNWQQGSMLQWLPSDCDKVIYNLSDNKNYKSRVIDIKNKECRDFDFPIYGIGPSGEYALSLDYKRLYWCRAYHYQPIQDPDYDGQIKKGDGIFKLDLKTGKVSLLLPIDRIVEFDPDDDFDQAKHWLEHIMISPDGKRFAFLHRFSYGNVMSYSTRLFICDTDGSNLQIVKDWRKYGWSHFGWCGNSAFAIYTYIAPKVGRLEVKPGVAPEKNLKHKFLRLIKSTAKAIIPRACLNKIVGKTSYYQFYKISSSGNCYLERNLAGGYFKIDGHPSFTYDGHYMITDTYPDNNGWQRLLIYNMSTGKQLELASFEAPLKGNPASCDLHPKLSRDNQYVTVDTAHSGLHQMFVFKLEWDRIKSVIG